MGEQMKHTAEPTRIVIDPGICIYNAVRHACHVAQIRGNVVFDFNGRDVVVLDGETAEEAISRWDTGRRIEAEQEFADASRQRERARACVLACEGISDPAAVPDVIKAIEGIIDAGDNSPPIQAVANVSKAIEVARAALARVKADSRPADSTKERTGRD